MIENYEKISTGHYYQTTLTDKIKEYNTDYVVSRYIKMDDSMSRLRYELITSYIEFESVCDFGYGAGSFLQFCSTLNKKVYGHDISNYPLPDHIPFVEDINDVNVDVITFFDSIEHIVDRDLETFLRNLNTRAIVISVPWMHEYMGPEWFRGWKHRRENEHIHHFDVSGLIELVNSSGFVPIHVSNSEDSIRKSVSYLPNILTIIAKKAIV